METAPSPFRYFRDPHHFSSYSEAGQLCPFCGLERVGYGGGFYGPEEHDALEFICEVCLASGKLAEKDLTINEASDVKAELRKMHPDWAKARIEEVSQGRAKELEERTPPVMTWQPLIWPTHCGDYCCFVKEAGKLDFDRLAPDGDGRAFFEAHLDEPGRNDVWDMVRPDAPKDNSVGYSTGVYLFQCLECSKYEICWDCG